MFTLSPAAAAPLRMRGLALCAGASRPRVAVVLSGCGVYDGSEIHEASAALVALSRFGARAEVYAPDKASMHTVNHATGEAATVPERNVLVESARIARGEIASLADLRVEKYHAVIFPGGFGAAKNLSDFAVAGPQMKVDADVERVIAGFHAAQKPIGLCCIAPVLAAKVLPGVTLTLGSDSASAEWPHSGAAGAATAMGAKHVNKTVEEVCVDEKNKVVTTPAFMCETDLHLIHDGVAAMVAQVLKLVSAK